MGMLDMQQSEIDPQTRGLLSAAFAGLKASGPSRMPVSLGQILGGAGEAGIGAYDDAIKAKNAVAAQQQQVELNKQHAALFEMQAQKAKADAAKEQARLDYWKTAPQQFMEQQQAPAPALALLSGNAQKYADALPAGEREAYINAQRTADSGLLGKFDTRAPGQNLAADMNPQPGLLAPQLNMQKLLADAAAKGHVPIETYMNHLAQQQERTAGREQRMQELQQRIDAAQQNGQDNRDMKLQMAQLIASSRQPPAPNILNTTDGIFALGRDGKPSALLNPSTNAPLLPASSARTDARDAAAKKADAFKLVKEYKSDPAIKSLEALTPSFEPLVDYMSRVEKNGKSENVFDRNLSQMYLGITKNSGQMVTNLDKNNLNALAPLGTRIGNAVSGVLAGKDLTDDVRKDMWKTVVEHMGAKNAQAKAKENDIAKRAASLEVPIELVFPNRAQKE
jgi:hypothetical protein